MVTNWKIRFNDGTEQVYAAETIAEAIDECELITGKRVRCAMYQPDEVPLEERAVVE
jgi:hypothetical protein